jgi:hypothetical protein
MDRSTEQKIALFRGLFAGRTDVYGTYDPATGCVRQVKDPVTDSVILAHLQGRRPYGVYLLVKDRTRAVVADFDSEELVAPMEFVKAGRAYEIPAYLERSKRKGFHAWIFYEEAGVAAAKARVVVRRILAEIEKPAVEVFPKQDRLDEATVFGNFINAPLFGALVPRGRTVFVDPGDPTRPHPDQWALLESVERVSEQLLDDMIELNGLNVATATIRHSSATVRNGVEHTFGLPPCARAMLADGVTENQRIACFRLAVRLKRAGLPFDSSIAVLKDWSTRNRPANGKRIITPEEVVSQAACAYDKEYRACGCEEPVVAAFCEPSCPVRNTVPPPSWEDRVRVAPPASIALTQSPATTGGTNRAMDAADTGAPGPSGCGNPVGCVCMHANMEETGTEENAPTELLPPGPAEARPLCFHCAQPMPANVLKAACPTCGMFQHVACDD